MTHLQCCHYIFPGLSLPSQSSSQGWHPLVPYSQINLPFQQRSGAHKSPAVFNLACTPSHEFKGHLSWTIHLLLPRLPIVSAFLHLLANTQPSELLAYFFLRKAQGKKIYIYIQPQNLEPSFYYLITSCSYHNFNPERGFGRGER